MKIRERVKNKIENKEREPFEKRNKIYPLVLLITIIPREQSKYYFDAYSSAGASLSLTIYSYSMPPEEYRNILGKDSTKKEILFTICRKEDGEKLLNIARERFKISKAAKGIAFLCPIDSVNGIAAYKFLADQNRELRGENDGRK